MFISMKCDQVFMNILIHETIWIKVKSFSNDFAQWFIYFLCWCCLHVFTLYNRLQIHSWCKLSSWVFYLYGNDLQWICVKVEGKLYMVIVIICYVLHKCFIHLNDLCCIILFFDSDISIACCIDNGAFKNDFWIFLMYSNVLVCLYLHFLNIDYICCVTDIYIFLLNGKCNK
jgi:hypothetical protein